jgi:hypothetical protein
MIRSDIIFKGLDRQVLHIHGESAPSASMGSFLIVNRGQSPRTARVKKVEFIERGESKEINEYFIYALPGYEELSSDRIAVKPGEELRLCVSFAPIPMLVGGRESYSVRVHVQVDGDVATTDSCLSILTLYPKLQ